MSNSRIPTSLPERYGMSLVELTEAYIADRRAERLRLYLEAGRRFAGLSTEALNAAWVETYRAARPFRDDSGEADLQQLRCEFDLRRVEPPMHLLAAEVERFVAAFQKRQRERPIDPDEADRMEEELEQLCERLQAPKH